MPKEIRPEAQAFLEQGERDVRNARGNLGLEAYEVSAFLSHQAVEKLLKALWIVERREMPPKTHSLLNLADGLGVRAQFADTLADLNTDYSVSRYPDAANGVPYEAYTESIATRKVASAEEVVAWLVQRIGQNDEA